MKTYPFFLLVLCIIISSCSKEECVQEEIYIQFTPVYQSKEEIREQVRISSPQALKSPSKIFSLGSYLFISDETLGVHIIDNTDPSAPAPVSLIEAPGARDMAVKGDYLYIDHFTDLLVVDISTPAVPQILEQVEDIFTGEGRDLEDEVIVDYKEEEITINGPCTGTTDWFSREDVFFVRDNVVLESSADVPSAISNRNGNNNNATGIAGSFSRFVVVDDGLYTVGRSSLRFLDLSNPQEPALAQELPLGWLIETIFSYKNHLFVGSQEGMFILEVRNDQQVEYVSEFFHSRACDPVYVTNETAYVTLRDGRECGDARNELLIVDVSDISNPDLMESYELLHPNGLSIAGDKLFIGQGAYGLYGYQLENRSQIKELFSNNDFFARDIISFNEEHIMVIGDDGLVQYAVSDELTPLSLIPVD